MTDDVKTDANGYKLHKAKTLRYTTKTHEKSTSTATVGIHFFLSTRTLNQQKNRTCTVHVHGIFQRISCLPRVIGVANFI